MLAIINGIVWAFLRRWFGGLFPDNTYKILGNRGLQTVVMLLALFPVILNHVCDIYKNIYVIFLLTFFITIWIQFQFWSRGHGATFLDMGRNKDPNEKRYDRWFKKPLDWCWDKLFSLKVNNTLFSFILAKWSGRMYGYTYDIIYHTLRYTLCMIIPAILLMNINFVLIGLLAAPVYELNLRLYERYKFKWMNVVWLNRSNKLSEIAYGFVFGALIII